MHLNDLKSQICKSHKNIFKKGQNNVYHITIKGLMKATLARMRKQLFIYAFEGKTNKGELEWGKQFQKTTQNRLTK